MSVDIRRETEELVRYYGELVRRLGQSGVRDVADLLALYERLGRALEAVSRQEIGWVTEQVQRVLADELPYIDLWYLDNVLVHNRRVRNLKLNPAGNYDFLRTAELVPNSESGPAQP